MADNGSIHNLSAYGGKGWHPRRTSLQEEMGRIWGRFGQNTEWHRLAAVLLHRPGPELDALMNANQFNMLQTPAADEALAQHERLAEAYRKTGVVVHYVDPAGRPPPNQMFVADLMLMTTEGAILARPASSVRAGEERWVARRLADLGIPILRSIRGRGTFEGADAMWLNPQTLLLGRGLRTNAAGAAQVKSLLKEMDIEVIAVDLPYGTMHLMGMLRIVDRDLALAWPQRLAHAAVDALRQKGYAVHFIPDEQEAVHGFALNFVTLEPRRILMASGNPVTQAFYESLGIDCTCVDIPELTKAAGGVGCLTGIVARQID
jgi:N-dimethylarginine dimethylaminohydrolase